MTTEITPQARPAVKRQQASTRHLVVDARFAELLAEDFAIAPRTILAALWAEPKKRAIAMCEWAARQADPAGALLAWARKHGRGTYGRRCRRVRTAGRPQRRRGEGHGGPREQQDGPAEGYGPRRGRGGYGGRS